MIMIIVKKTKENICVFAHRIFYIHNPVNCNSKEAAYINLAGYTYSLEYLLCTPNNKEWQGWNFHFASDQRLHKTK